MAWIKFDKDLIDDPRILRAAEDLCARYVVSIESVRGPGFAAGSDLEEKAQLAIMRNAVTGALLTLWVYADTHIRNGDVLQISITAIDRLVGIDGFYELVGEDWIRPADDGMSVVLPGYCEKNGLISKEKRKTSNSERQRRFRDRQRQFGNANSNAVTNATVTALDQDQDLDQKQLQGARAPDVEFERLWKTYPKRAGNNPKRKAESAYKARLLEKHTPLSMLDGAARYAKFVRSTGKEGTEYVLQTATFLGKDTPFLQPWTAPNGQGAWDRTETATLAMGAELGLPARPGESMEEYRGRIRTRIAS